MLAVNASLGLTYTIDCAVWVGKVDVKVAAVILTACAGSAHNASTHRASDASGVRAMPRRANHAAMTCRAPIITRIQFIVLCNTTLYLRTYFLRINNSG